VTAPAVGTGLAANLLGQVGKSKTAQTMLRPTIAFLQNKKRAIDDALVVDPDNKILQRVSNGLSDAIASKDETRRAAALNTLMQYESIRKLFKDEE
jgi:CRISPR/Cas system CMR-associated protein Cmr5 small subunit